MSSHLGLFLRELVQKPGQVVALAPSSARLASEMVAELDPAGGPVVELGPGTGVITRAILERGVPADRLTCLELNPKFCAHLRQEFPGIAVLQKSATELGDIPNRDLQAVVSGLPLLSMPSSVQRAILSGACKLLAPGGLYTQFTYGPMPPVAKPVREEFALKWRGSRKIWANLPPARVYRFWQDR